MHISQVQNAEEVFPLKDLLNYIKPKYTILKTIIIRFLSVSNTIREDVEAATDYVGDSNIIITRGLNSFY